MSVRVCAGIAFLIRNLFNLEPPRTRTSPYRHLSGADLYPARAGKEPEKMMNHHIISSGLLLILALFPDSLPDIFFIVKSGGGDPGGGLKGLFYGLFFAKLRSWSLLKMFSQGKGVPEFKPALEPAADAADQPSIDQGLENRSALDPFKAAKAEKDKGEENGSGAAATVIGGLDPVDGKAVFFADFLNHQLVGLRRNVGVKKHAYARGAEQQAGEKNQKPASGAAAGDIPEQGNKEIQDQSIEDGGDKGKEITLFGAPQNDTEQDQKDGLEGVLGDPEGVKGQDL